MTREEYMAGEPEGEPEANPSGGAGPSDLPLELLAATDRVCDVAKLIKTSLQCGWVEALDAALAITIHWSQRSE